MTVQKKIKSNQDVTNYFKELSYYNTYIKKPKIKPLRSMDLLSELPFYEELSVIKTDEAFKGYAMWYKVELVIHYYELSEKISINSARSK